MAKLSSINKNERRKKLVQQNAAKYAKLKAIADDESKDETERLIARLKMAELPRNGNPTRVPVARQLGHLQARDEALGLVLGLVVRDRFQLRVLRSILLDELPAPLVLVDRTQFRHDLSSSPNGEAAHAASRCSSCGKGKLNRRSSSRASSSVFAVVVMMTSMPRTLSIWS